MYFLYSILFTLGIIALLPRFAYDALRKGKYVVGLGERLGRLPPLSTEDRPVIWLHCVSVGETQAARSLVSALLDEYPTHALVVSTTTATGQRVARQVFKDDAAAVFYFPFDWAWTVRRALKIINPQTVLIMETELWPRFLRECRRRRIAVAVVNGRLSERSFRRYRIARGFISRVVNCLSLALMQSEADAARVRALGLEAGRVLVSGNVKFDAGVDEFASELTFQLRERFQLDDARPLIVAASTHAPEERVVVDAYRQLRAASSLGMPRLLIAPRHPERFAEVAAMLDASGFRWSRRSSAASEFDSSCEIILLDSIGELRAVYALAALVFVGGSIAPVGGHNVLEPAATGACIITGPHTFNFAAIMKEFLEAEALVQLPLLRETEYAARLAQVCAELLTDERRRARLSAQARLTLEQNRGATMRTLKMLAPLLPVTPADRSARGRAQSSAARSTLSS
ncbi:MAG: 3-deoxy-D-manno-octulosonic-acid transferase [Blastocatellia bacterium]|jgi:3-deoxy-D-manno-octulosonic-acid transferase|nr:3-deoxy-D-manno-octulosonic-acid transferase [Blastocatellia bacterium]